MARCRTRFATNAPASTSRSGWPATRPCRRRAGCVARRGAPTAHARPRPRARGRTPGARPPPRTPGTAPGPAPATGAGLAAVIPRTRPPADPAPAPRPPPRTDMRDQHLSSSSNSTRSTTVFSTPSRAGHTVGLRTPLSDHISSGPSTAQNLWEDGVLHAQQVRHRPRKRRASKLPLTQGRQSGCVNQRPGSRWEIKNYVPLDWLLWSKVRVAQGGSKPEGGDLLIPRPVRSAHIEAHRTDGEAAIHADC